MPVMAAHNFVKMKSSRKEDVDYRKANEIHKEWLEEDAGANSFASRVKERASARKNESGYQYELLDTTG